MSIQKIAKYAKHFDLLIVHEEGFLLPFQEYAADVFRTVNLKSPDKIIADTSSTSCHLLIICGSYDFFKKPSLKNAVSLLHPLETIILTPDYTNINIFKLALFFRVANVSAVPSNEEEFVKTMMGVFSTLVKKHNESIVNNYERMISEFSTHLFWVHKQEKAVYANETFKRKFGIKSLDELNRYFHDKDMADLFKSSGIAQKIISKEDVSGEIKEYLVINQPLNDGEQLVSMVPLLVPLKNEKQLHNRMGFIELLKDAFVIHKGENEAIPVIIMHIENSDKIIEMHDENIFNDLCKEMIELAQVHFKDDIEIAQWNKHIYTLIASRASLDELKKSLEKFHQNLKLEASVDGASLVIDSFIIDMHGVELNKAIGIIDHIKHKQLLSRDLAHLVHFEISASPQESVDEQEHALHYLEKMIMSKTPVKVLNFYKGIRISTAAQIVKISNETVYLSIEKIQGYAMKLEQHVVIQGTNIPFDILASVKIVDVAKKIAVLSNFEPLEASGNNRQYIRIQSDHRMHVTIATAKSVISGTILDISIKSIACKLSVSKVPLKLDSKVNLQFNLPLDRFEGGMVTMVIAGKIQYIQEGDEFTKVVVELILSEPYESYLIEYIYARQQALVNEIKTIANKL